MGECEGEFCGAMMQDWWTQKRGPWRAGPSEMLDRPLGLWPVVQRWMHGQSYTQSFEGTEIVWMQSTPQRLMC